MNSPLARCLPRRPFDRKFGSKPILEPIQSSSPGNNFFLCLYRGNLEPIQSRSPGLSLDLMPLPGSRQPIHSRFPGKSFI